MIYENITDSKDILWEDRKRTIFGLPLSFTKYKLTGEKMFISTGFFNTKEEEIRLYRILDMTLRRSLGEKLFGVGTIMCDSADKSTPRFEIKHIKQSKAVKELLSDIVEEQRDKKRVGTREYMTDMSDSDMGGMM